MRFRCFNVRKAPVKRLTRRQVERWFEPIRSALGEMKSGEVAAIDDYAVTRLDADDAYTRVDYCIAGWMGCIGRIFPAVDLSALSLLKDRLEAKEPVTVAEIDRAFSLLKSLEKPLIRVPFEQIKSAMLDEQLAIEFDVLGQAR